MFNEEIKEIYLSNLEWTKTHNNIGGVMGNFVLKKNISYEEYEKMLKSGYFILCNKDYITNLQQENERLKKPDYYEKGLIGSIKERDDIIQDYKSRCEKAIPMLKELNECIKDILNIEIDIKNISDIENILQNGSENDE